MQKLFSQIYNQKIINILILEGISKKKANTIASSILDLPTQNKEDYVCKSDIKSIRDEITLLRNDIETQKIYNTKDVYIMFFLLLAGIPSILRLVIPFF